MGENICPDCRFSNRPSAKFCARCGEFIHASVAAKLIRHPQVTAVEKLKEISFDQLHATDNILIQTENNYYEFVITDPISRRGRLSGGSFENHLCEATLIGIRFENQQGFHSDNSRLKTESQALFYVKSEKGFERLTTSTITSLVHIHTAA